MKVVLIRVIIGKK